MRYIKIGCGIFMVSTSLYLLHKLISKQISIPTPKQIVAKGQNVFKDNNSLIQFLKIKYPMVEQAMLKVDRKSYLPPETINPYVDTALPIGFNATLSSASLHASGLESLFDVISPNGRVLDIGCGSGYMCACFSYILGDEGKVFGIDHIQELVDYAQENIEKGNPDILHKVNLICKNGMEGWEEMGPFDAIYVGAAAEEIPKALVNQLKLGGKMMIPVGPRTSFHTLLVVTKDMNGVLSTKSMGNVRFTPLTTTDIQLGGEHGGARTRVMVIDGEQTFVLPSIVPAPDTSEEDLKKMLSILQDKNTNEDNEVEDV